MRLTMKVLKSMAGVSSVLTVYISFNEQINGHEVNMLYCSYYYFFINASASGVHKEICKYVVSNMVLIRIY